MKPDNETPASSTSSAATPQPRATAVDKGPVAPGSDRESDNQGALPLPHERDESAGPDATGRQGSGAAGENQQIVMERARRDLAEGQVDTDLRATPGVDAERQRELVKKGARGA